MSKLTLDSDIYGDIYGDDAADYPELPLEEPQEVQDDTPVEVTNSVQPLPSAASEPTNTPSLSMAEAKNRLPAKPPVAVSTNMSYSAQVAKQFSAYQQTPNQERQVRTENQLAAYPRTNSARPSVVADASSAKSFGSTPSDAVFGKKPSEMHDAGKLFVGGLSWDTTDEGLRDYFSQFGTVDACTIMRDASGTSRGFAFLTFEDAPAVDVVVGREHVLDGKNIDPKRAIPREEHLRNTRYFVGGLSPNTTSDSMRRFFSTFGKVVDATVMIDRETSRGKGFGFVTFEDAVNAEQLVGKIGLVLDDKQIEVKAAQPRNQRDQTRTSTHSSTADQTTDATMLSNTTVNFIPPMNTPNPLGMLNPRFLNQMPLGMMNMNQMMGMGFNGLNMGSVPGMNPMGGMDGMFNFGNMGGIRLGMGPIGGLGIGTGLALPTVLRSTPQPNGLRPAGMGRITGTSIGPSRTTSRGHHSFHPYAR